MQARKLTALLAVPILLASTAGIANADELQNDVASSAAGKTVTITSGGAGASVKYWIRNNSAGGASSGFDTCDAADGSPVTVTVNSPANVTATPNSLVFTQCGSATSNTQSVTFTSSTTGSYPITHTTTDTRGNYNVAPAAFTLQVNAPSTTTPPADTTPPVLTLPADITEEATGPSGAAVTFTATANDAVDGSRPVTCSPASGDTFPLGQTTVNCSASDSSGNNANGSFKVTVVDTTPPTLNLPGNQNVQATSASGAEVTYTATANDAVDGSRPVTCSPASGDTFPLGQTTVNCSASDSSANNANGSFDVTVAYKFTGFFAPVDGGGTINVTKAGRAIPIKFSLSGDMGLNIFRTGWPMSVTSSGCTGTEDAVESTVTAGSSSLSYDSVADRYNYVWKSDAAWAGKCRKLTLGFADGTDRSVMFRFTK